MEPISPNDLTDAIDDLSICEFFPTAPAAQAAIMRLLTTICPHREALRWLVGQFTNTIGKWHGPVELRGVLCTRYKPADGIEAYSSIPGFTCHESESAMLEQHEQAKAGSWDEETEHRKELPEIDRILQLLTGKRKL